ncbi:hypothetical protein HanIR_Chr04g0154481 [Helianthus annuus]|nr:hypothetical protein HanIR_Chr10g0481991 [Helianthus annuus]KAJ0586673.1 hypothetical protein HanIR_Chr04g0154481 [Helianthus annuus]
MSRSLFRVLIENQAGHRQAWLPKLLNLLILHLIPPVLKLSNGNTSKAMKFMKFKQKNNKVLKTMVGFSNGWVQQTAEVPTAKQRVFMKIWVGISGLLKSMVQFSGLFLQVQ